MDCQMPVMDGFAATTAIRDEERQRGGGRTPIVAVTASAMTYERRHCLDLGMDAVLCKPFTCEQLTTMLRLIAEDVGSADNGGSRPGSDRETGYAEIDTAQAC